MIGADWALTGAANNPLAAYVTSATMATAQLNAALKKAGSALVIDFQVEDYGTDKVSAADKGAVIISNATDLVNNKGAKVLITDSGTAMTALGPLNYDSDPSNDLLVPNISAGSSDANLNNPSYVPDPLLSTTPTDPTALAVLQAWERDADNWYWRTIASAKFGSVILGHIAVDLCAPAGDCNKDGKVKWEHLQSTGALNQYAAIQTLVSSAAVGGLTINYIEELTPFSWTAGTNSLSPPVSWAQGKVPSLASYLAADLTDMVARAQDNVTAVIDNSTTTLTTTTDGYADFVELNKNAAQEAGILQAFANANALTTTPGGPFYFVDAGTFFDTSAGGFQASNAALVAGLPLAGYTAYSYQTASVKQYVSDYTAASGSAPSVTTGGYRAYDAVVLAGLAMVYASKGLATASLVTGASVREALSHLNDLDGTLVGSGTAGLTQAVELILAGERINYDGASGPVDFNTYGDVFSAFTEFKGVGTDLTVVKKFDCNADPSCPEVPL